MTWKSNFVLILLEFFKPVSFLFICVLMLKMNGSAVDSQVCCHKIVRRISLFLLNTFFLYFVIVLLSGFCGVCNVLLCHEQSSSLMLGIEMLLKEVLFIMLL